MKLTIERIADDRPTFEVVEHKGPCHPDSLSDDLANFLSRCYADLTFQQYGCILNHNFDKLGLLGGESLVDFGEGQITSPIRVLINGRASTRFAENEIEVWPFLRRHAADFLTGRMPNLSEENLHFVNNLSTASSPGRTITSINKGGTRNNWFSPKGRMDLFEQPDPVANDTSIGVGFYPYSALERCVKRIAEELSNLAISGQARWLGRDFKILGVRIGENFEFTLCIPQICVEVENVNAYEENLKFIREFVLGVLARNDVNPDNCQLFLNTRDLPEVGEFYLTLTGSSIETGDEGLVGRGNRINGLITPLRPMSLEGSAGKNPVNHIGKVYYQLAGEICRAVYEETDYPCSCVLVSQSGQPLSDPWHVSLVLTGAADASVERRVAEIIDSKLTSLRENAARMLGQI